MTSARNPHDALAGIGRYDLERMYLDAVSLFVPLLAEINRARTLHAGGANLAALVEEIGEVARARLEGKPDDERTELLHVAATAMRLYFGERAEEP